MKPLSQRIKAVLRKHPHWSAKRVAEHLDVDSNVISVTATRSKIKFMSRREVEDWIDGKKV